MWQERLIRQLFAPFDQNRISVRHPLKDDDPRHEVMFNVGPREIEVFYDYYNHHICVGGWGAGNYCLIIKLAIYNLEDTPFEWLGPIAEAL